MSVIPRECPFKCITKFRRVKEVGHYFCTNGHYSKWYDHYYYYCELAASSYLDQWRTQWWCRSPPPPILESWICHHRPQLVNGMPSGFMRAAGHKLKFQAAYRFSLEYAIHCNFNYKNHTKIRSKFISLTYTLYNFLSTRDQHAQVWQSKLCTCIFILIVHLFAY